MLWSQLYMQGQFSLHSTACTCGDVQRNLSGQCYEHYMTDKLDFSEVKCDQTQQVLGTIEHQHHALYETFHTCAPHQRLYIRTDNNINQGMHRNWQCWACPNDQNFDLANITSMFMFIHCHVCYCTREK
jgi:hypothetical protein